MLTYHDNTRGLSCTSDTRDGEQFVEADKEVIVSSCSEVSRRNRSSGRACGITKSLSDLQCLLKVELSLDIIHIAGCLESGVSEANERVEGLLHLVLLEVPTWAFGTEPDLGTELD